MKKSKAAVLILVAGLVLLFFRLLELWTEEGEAFQNIGSNIFQIDEGDQISKKDDQTSKKDDQTNKKDDQTSRKGDQTGGESAQTDKEGDQTGRKGDQIDEECKKIALTFDDGPHPYYTDQLLDGLGERGVKATFFVTGENASLHPDTIRRMQEEGHLIGNHTYSHIQLRPDNREVFREELKKTNEVLQEITGQEVMFVRPPYGTWDKSLEKELNMIPVLWTVDPLDWCSDDVSCITERVISKVKEYDIILLHDYYETSVTAALEIVDRLLEQGYEFVTVDELLLE